MADALPPADWFPDPTGRHEQRWWDGGSWTEHVFTAGAQSIDPLATQASGDATSGPAAGDETPTADDVTDGTPTEPAVDEVVEVDDQAPHGAAVDTAGDAPAADAAGEAPDVAPVEAGATSDPVPQAAVDDAEATPDPVPQAAVDDAGETPEAVPQGDPDEDARGARDELRALADELAGRPAGGPDRSTAPDGWFLLDAPVRAVPGERPTPGQPAGPAAPGPDTVAPEPQPDPEPDPVSGPDPQDDPASAPPAEPARPIPGGFVAGRPAPIDPTPPATRPEPEPEPVPPTAAEAEPAPDPAPVAREELPSGEPQVQPPMGRVTGPLVDAARVAAGADDEPVGLENRRLLRCRLDGGSVLARQGTMVAHRGELDVRHEGAGGVGRVLRRAATGEGVRMMRVTGQGEVFLADGARHVFVLHLEDGARLSVSGRSVLAFSEGLEWEVRRVQGATIVGGGLFATDLRGDGWVALVSDGEPLVLRTDDEPVLVDTQALVAWSTDLAASVQTSVKLPALVGLGSGEAVQLRFSGDGLVVVQPSEGRTAT